MSLPRDIFPAGHVENVADPPSRPVVQTCQPPQPNMEGNQLVQWLSAQASNMPGDLQHNVRALMLRASSPTPVSDGHDEVASLRKQLGHQQQTHREMQTMLKNHVLAIEAFQSKWQNDWSKKHIHVWPRLTGRRRHASRTPYSAARRG